MTIPQDDLQLPTKLERTAYLLKERQGLTDIEIAKLMGIRRETANRYRAAFRRKVATSFTKNGKEATQPLSTWLIDELRT